MPLRTGFRIGPREVRPLEGRVHGPQGDCRIEPKAMEVLLELARHAPEVRSREQIEHCVWPRGYVSEDVLTRCIGQLRRALGDAARSPALLETIPKRGYRLRVVPQPLAQAHEGQDGADAARTPQEAQRAPDAGLQHPTALASPSAFVGREPELAEIERQLAAAPGCVLTLVGPGGSGKSRLAQVALERLTPRFAGGVVWVELQDLREYGAVVVRLARQFGVTLEDTGDTGAASGAQAPMRGDSRLAVELAVRLAAQLGARRALGVLDNAEHLQGLPLLVAQLREAAPTLSWLVTSRAPLGVSGEALLPLGGLAAADAAGTDGDPESGADAADEGVRLFAARARAALPGFDMAQHREAVAAIVHATAGLPLAIELAASWVRLLPPPAIAQELSRSIDLLESDDDASSPWARPEHRSMRAVLDRSWQLLSPRERETLTALSVFRGGFTAGAAREVVRSPLVLLAALVDKGLLGADTQGRFKLHPLTHADATARLQRDPALAASLHARHAQHFAGWLEQLAERAAADHRPVVTGIEIEDANCDAAWHHAASTRACAQLYRSLEAWRIYYEVRGRATQGIAHFQAALPACDGDDRLRARLNAALARLYFRKGDFATGSVVAHSGIDCAERSGERRALVACLAGAGNCASAQGRWREAGEFFSRALDIGRADGVVAEVATALGNLGVVAKREGRYDDALAFYAQALSIEREQQHHVAIVRLLNNMAGLHMERDQWQPARELMTQGVALCERHGLDAQRPYLEFGLGAALLELGEVDAAEQHLTLALQRSREAEIGMIMLWAELNLARVAERRGQRDQATAGLRRVAAEARERDWHGLLLHVALFHGEALARAGRRVEAARAWRAVVAEAAAEAGMRDSATRWLQQLALSADEQAVAAQVSLSLSQVVECIGLDGGTARSPNPAPGSSVSAC